MSTKHTPPKVHQTVRTAPVKTHTTGEGGDKAPDTEPPAGCFRFLLLGGEYRDLVTDKLYVFTKGKRTYVEDHRRLDKAFPGTFRRVSASEPLEEDEEDVPVEEEETDATGDEG